MLVFFSLLTTMALGIASAFVAALAYGATALIVPGTGTPNADPIDGYRENAWSRYIDGVVCTDVGKCSEPDLVGIPYPASFWPLSFIPNWCVTGRCEKWNVSVDEGTANLMTALDPFLDEDSNEDVFIFGYSQGGAVVSDALTELAALGLSDDVKKRLKIVTIGGIENPDGGLWQRLAWLQYLLGNPVPVLDISFNPPMLVDTGIDTTTIGFQYDPVVYAPQYWGNGLAILNMIAAFDEVHPYYLAPNAVNENPMPYGYTDLTLAPQLNCQLNPGNCRTDSFGNSYIMIPATSLPLTNLIRSLADSLHIGWLAKPFIDLAEPVIRVAVDLGFDWSGNPGVPTRSTILPFKIFQNWLQVGVDFAVAAVKGVEAFVRNFIPEEAATTARDSDENVAALTVTPDDDASVTPPDESTSDDEQVPADVVIQDEDEDVTTDEDVVTDEDVDVPPRDDDETVVVDGDLLQDDEVTTDVEDEDTQEDADPQTSDEGTDPVADTDTPAAA